MKNLVKVFVSILFLLIVCFVFADNRSSAKEPCGVRLVKASHILVNSKQEATLIKSKIDNGGSFEEMAKLYSKCPSGKEGGDLGYFERGQMVKEFEDVAFALPIGQVSNPVETQFGWHLIKVYDKR